MQMGPETRWSTLTGQGWVRCGWKQRSLVALEVFLPRSPGAAAVGRLVVGGWWFRRLACCQPVLLSCWPLDKPCVLPGFGLGDVRLNEWNTGAAGQQSSRAAGLRGRGEIETVERKRGEGGGVTREESSSSSSSSSGNQQRLPRPRRLSLIFGSFNEAMFPRTGRRVASAR